MPKFPKKFNWYWHAFDWNYFEEKLKITEIKFCLDNQIGRSAHFDIVCALPRVLFDWAVDEINMGIWNSIFWTLLVWL